MCPTLLLRILRSQCIPLFTPVSLHEGGRNVLFIFASLPIHPDTIHACPSSPLDVQQGMESRMTTTRTAGRAMLGAVIWVASVSGAGAAQPAACDRQCLNPLADSYLAALVAHDPSRAPLASDVE
jgi:hypothetical protein